MARKNFWIWPRCAPLYLSEYWSHPACFRPVSRPQSTSYSSCLMQPFIFILLCRLVDTVKWIWKTEPGGNTGRSTWYREAGPGWVSFHVENIYYNLHCVGRACIRQCSFSTNQKRPALLRASPASPFSVPHHLISLQGHKICNKPLSSPLVNSYIIRAQAVLYDVTLMCFHAFNIIQLQPMMYQFVSLEGKRVLYVRLLFYKNVSSAASSSLEV